jgi:hypothetical protein
MRGSMSSAHRLVHVTRILTLGFTLLVPTACSSSDSQPSFGAASPGSTGAAPATDRATDGTAGTDGAPSTLLPPDPLEALLNPNPSDSTSADLLRRQTDAMVAECMHDLGWEYWVDQSDPSDEAMNSRPNADTGYGIVAGYETYRLPELQGAPPPTVPIDKNIEYQQTLSPDDAARYRKDLSGDTAPDDPDNADAYENSCNYTAAAQAGTLLAFDQIDGLEDRLRELLMTVDSNPAVAAALAEFAACVTDSFGPQDILGHSVADDPFLFLLMLRDQAMGLDLVEDDDETADAYGRYGLRDGTNISSVGTPQPIPDAPLEQLRETELRLYTANLECTLSSGVEQARIALHTEIAEQLQTEFPDLATFADG